MRFRCTAAFLLALIPAAARGQIVRGRVVDATSGDGVPQASVGAFTAEQHGAGRTRTEADGSFLLDLRAPGTFTLRSERTGYQATVSRPVEVAVRETVTVTLRLSVQPTQIDPLTVTARAQPPHRRSLENSGFYEREAMGIGRFLRREDIDRMADHNIVHVLGRVPGVVIDVDRRGNEIVSFSRGRMVGTLSRGQSGQQNICFPAIYLDGVHMNYDAQMPDLKDVIQGDQVEAVEVFRSSSEIPAQYNGTNSACGVILIYTRHEIDPAPAAPAH
jgi:hypothetical protein